MPDATVTHNRLQVWQKSNMSLKAKSLFLICKSIKKTDKMLKDLEQSLKRVKVLTEMLADLNPLVSFLVQF